MKYMGSKNSIAGLIIPHLSTPLVEPFCGGCNITDKVSGPRFASDTHPELIEMWKAVSKGWEPPKTFTEDEYYCVRDKPSKFDPALVGYVGFALSYGGKWFGGWCRDRAGKRDYVQEARRNALKQFPKLLGVAFSCHPYDEIEIPNGATVYCDPPYRATTAYKNKFDSDKFWAWAEQVGRNNKIFVSEYTAPQGWTEVFAKQKCSSLEKNTGSKKAIEKMFTL